MKRVYDQLVREREENRNQHGNQERYAHDQVLFSPKAESRVEKHLHMMQGILMVDRFVGWYDICQSLITTNRIKKMLCLVNNQNVELDRFQYLS